MLTKAMPTKTEFKFNCPTCGQHILAAAAWIGRQIECPSCDTNITIPSPPKEEKKSGHVMPPSPATHPDYSKRVVRVEVPTKASKAAESKAASPPTKTAPSATSSPAQPQAATTVQPQPAKAAQDPKSKTTDSKAASPPTKTAPGATTSPAKPQAATVAQPQKAAQDAKSKTTDAAPKEPQALRVAVLTPAIKLDMVRSVRQRIRVETSWLPDKLEGTQAYAAKVSDGKTVLVDVKSPEATRFSLIGAFLLEFHKRQVIRTATGRTRLLDQEIPEAVRDVLEENMSDEEREEAEEMSASPDLTDVTHAQCLAALDTLEERYSHRMNQMRAEKAKRKINNVRLPDLVKKLEKKARIAPEDVAAALFHELVEVRHRLDSLESRIGQDKK